MERELSKNDYKEKLRILFRQIRIDVEKKWIKNEIVLYDDILSVDEVIELYFEELEMEVTIREP